MVSLKTKILLILIVIGLPLFGQSFTYSYIDPCTHDSKFIIADMSAPIVISYYGQIQTFTYAQLSDGTFDSWINNIYNKYKTTSPCQGVLTTTTTTTSTNQVSNIIGNITSLVNLDLSSMTSGISGGVGNNIGGNVNSGTNINSNNKKDDNSTSNNNNSGSNSEINSNSNGQTTGENGGNPPENQSGSNGNGGGGVNGGNNNSNNSGSNSGNSSGGRNDGNVKGEEKKPEEQKVEEQKTETQKTQSQSTAKAASKAKTETQKPAILLTGDIVGIQTKANGAQDARATTSFTKVKGDGTASLGLSADFMFNARIGNISGIRSWIGNNKSGNKHINIVSGGIGFLPKSTTGTGLFVRVNSIKKFTALYGVAGTYGKLYGEELISPYT